jgi:hypothetical protein
MPSPYNFRRGWESEHLAKFILSKFSFVAEPSTISDDLGSDFFCTLFKVEDGIYLLPQNSFAIQVKSKKDVDRDNNKIEITDKQSYLNGLEIPFFVGVVDRDNLKLSIYVGEYLCDYFSLLPNHGEVQKVFIELIEERSEPLKMFRVEGDKAYIEFPKVLEIEAGYEYASDPDKIKDLFSLCKLIQENIASKLSHEYIFKKSNNNFFYIYTGGTSVQHFRTNFKKRLAEVFFNLKWLHDTNSLPKEAIKSEFEIYKRLYCDLLDREGNLPDYLTKIFDELNRLMT